MQNIQKPWRHKIGNNSPGPPHASGLVEQEAKMGTCDSEVKKHKYQKPYEKMNIFYIISEMQNKMAIRYSLILQTLQKKLKLLNIESKEDNRNTYILVRV